LGEHTFIYGGVVECFSYDQVVRNTILLVANAADAAVDAAVAAAAGLANLFDVVKVEG